jgi:hypothetical protein
VNKHAKAALRKAKADKTKTENSNGGNTTADPNAVTERSGTVVARRRRTAS